MRRRCRGKEEPWEEQDRSGALISTLAARRLWKISAAARQREHLRVGDAAGCARSDGPIKKDRQMVAAVASIAAPARLPRRCLTFVSRWGIES